MQSKEPKIWLSIKDMINEYPLSERQIRRRLSNSIIPKNKIREQKSRRGNPTKLYHHTITDELLRQRRKLSKNEKEKTIKWVNNHRWKMIGNIVPESSNVEINKTIIKEIYKDLKGIVPNSDLKMFYSVERNTKDKYHHTHFLIGYKTSELTIRDIRNILERYVGKNTNKERRIDLKNYDCWYGKGGSVYSGKRRKFYELLTE